MADGVGGSERGEVASRLAVETALDDLPHGQFGPGAAQGHPSSISMLANRAIYDEALKNAAGQMATTLTIAVFRHNEVTIGNVGDSRVYLVRSRKIKQLDHRSFLRRLCSLSSA